MTKLSIITINYNDVVGLKRTFESVVNQTWKEFEYIVIDGGSNDGSKEFLEENNDQLTYWISEPDKGIYNAMNKGINVANGEYLLFLNSGDFLYSRESFEKAKKVLEKAKKDIYYGNIIVRGQEDRLPTFPDTLSFNYFYTGTLHHPASFVRKSCLLEMGGDDESLKIVSDWKFFIVGIFKKGFSFEYFDEIVSVFDVGGVSSTNSSLMAEERELVLAQEFPLFLSDYKEFNFLKYYSERAHFKSFIKMILFIKSFFRINPR